MRIALSLWAAVLLAGWSAPALAQVPPGSYLHSCRHVRIEGPSLVAVCRRLDGVWQRTVLPGFRGCVGGISNDNGVLRCARAGGPPPPYNPYRERRAECARVEHALRVTDERLEHTPPSEERERLERRMYELRRERRNLCGP
jgi:hypothetical protein